MKLFYKKLNKVYKRKYYIIIMDIPIYRNKLPLVDENVQVIFTEFKDTHIEAQLLDYHDINGMMIYEDATRKKKVYDWRKEIPLNKTIVAKVEEIYSDTYVKLSTGYFDQKLEPSELRKELSKPFVEMKALINIFKKICKNNNIIFNNFWINVIYEINDKKNEENLNESLLNYINENIELFTEILKINYPDIFEKIIEEFKSQVINKIYKIQSKFSLTTKKSIENIKELLILASNNTNWLFTIKYETTPIFILESSSENSTEENHDEFLNFLENNAKSYEINYIRIN
jgi:hypothetical protein